MNEPKESERRIPDVVACIQVNFCKNPVCANFGIPASNEPQPRGTGAGRRGRDSYTVIWGKRGPFLLCGKCGEPIPIKSSKAIKEELYRQYAYLNNGGFPSCPNKVCRNHDKFMIEDYNKGKYWALGRTKNGATVPDANPEGRNSRLRPLKS